VVGSESKFSMGNDNDGGQSDWATKRALAMRGCLVHCAVNDIANEDDPRGCAYRCFDVTYQLDLSKAGNISEAFAQTSCRGLW